MSAKPIFRGVGTALITPFRDGRVDYDAFAKIIEAQISGGVAALVIAGTTGESATLSDREKLDTIAFAVKTAAGRVPIIAGTGSNNTAHSIELSRAAMEVGADALLVVTPYYNKTSQQGLVTMYKTIADSVEIPIIIYNVPSRTGVNIEPATYAALADHPRLAAIKEANGNIAAVAETAALVGDRMTLYSGNDDQIVPILSLGGQGVISVLSNVLPRETTELCQAYFDKKPEQALSLQLRLLPLIKALFSDVNPIPVKEAMAMLGYCTPELRLPLVRMSPDKQENLRQKLADAGLPV